MNLFTFSKIFWILISPLNVIIIFLILGYLLSFLKIRCFSKIFYYLVSIFILFFCILPIGPYLNYLLEKDFHSSNYYPEYVDGILILSGATSPFLTKEHDQVAMNGSAERLIESVLLIKKYPDAKVIFSGGSGSTKYPNLDHANAAKKFFENMNIDSNKIEFETNSKNTYENILFSKKLINPQSDEKWLIITSAFHLKRSLAVAEKLEWKLIPFATDFNSPKNFFENYTFSFHFIGNLDSFNHSLHEWIGLFAYYYMGRTSHIF